MMTMRMNKWRTNTGTGLERMRHVAVVCGEHFLYGCDGRELVDDCNLRQVSAPNDVAGLPENPAVRGGFNLSLSSRVPLPLSPQQRLSQ